MKENNIHPMGFCPIARGADTKKCPNISEHKTITTLSQKYDKSGAQIMLNWGLQRGHIVIPRSSNFDRCVENFKSITFKLEESDV